MDANLDEDPGIKSPTIDLIGESGQNINFRALIKSIIMYQMVISIMLCLIDNLYHDFAFKHNYFGIFIRIKMDQNGPNQNVR